MKRICLTVVGIYLLFLHTFPTVTTKDTTFTKSRKLKLEEVDLVSSYYTQTGDHSAIRGGIGSEQVTDLANGLELKWVGWDAHQRKNSLTAGMGVDHHTAASRGLDHQRPALQKGPMACGSTLRWTGPGRMNKRGVPSGQVFTIQMSSTITR